MVFVELFNNLIHSLTDNEMIISGIDLRTRKDCSCFDSRLCYEKKKVNLYLNIQTKLSKQIHKRRKLRGHKGSTKKRRKSENTIYLKTSKCIFFRGLQCLFFKSSKQNYERKTVIIKDYVL